jgi:hypothetical protein
VCAEAGGGKKLSVLKGNQNVLQKRLQKECTFVHNTLIYIRSYYSGSLPALSTNFLNKRLLYSDFIAALELGA